MPWSTTSDIEELVSAAGAFLSSQPVLHCPLLTEVDHLRRHREPLDARACGWWTDERGVVAAAFLRAPRHATLATPLPDRAAAELVRVVRADSGIGCDATSVDAVLAAWGSVGVELAPRDRLVIHRLERMRSPAAVAGRSRTATDTDGALLHRWFDELMAANPDDPSDRAYVIDDPLADGRIVLWERDGVPVGMAGRSRTVDGMTRVGATYVPSADPRIETAVLAAATAAADGVAHDVLALAGTGDREGTTRLAALGYRAVRERILLAPVR